MTISLDPVINGGKGTVSTGYAAGAVTVVLSSGDGAKFPSSFSYNVVWWNSTDYSEPSDDPSVEIVRVTSRTGDSLTVTRGQEGTADVAHNTGGKTYKVILAITKKMIDDIDAHTHDIDELGDVTLTSIADGEIQRYTGSGGWVNNTIAELITDINQLGNVVITSIAVDEVLGYSGGNWINRTLVEAGIAASGVNADITSLTSCALIDGDTVDLVLTAVAGGAVVINDAQENVDFRIESDANVNAFFVDASIDAVGIGTGTPSQYADLTLELGKLCIKETTTPTADADYGKIYTKSDNKLYFQSGDGVEHEIAYV